MVFKQQGDRNRNFNYQNLNYRLKSQTIDWQIGIHENYLPVYYKGAIAGFLRQDYADRLMGYLHTEIALNQALTQACTDLVRQSGGNLENVQQVVARYIKNCLQSQHGTQGIVYRLQQRQLELNLNDRDFADFCDTFKLSPVDLGNIYAGNSIDDGLLAPLAKILGMSKQELQQLRDGE